MGIYTCNININKNSYMHEDIEKNQQIHTPVKRIEIKKLE